MKANHLNYNHLFFFYKAVSCGNTNRAAREMHVAQTAISLCIKKLEAQLGHKLFKKKGTSKELTLMGAGIYSYCEDIFNAGEKIKRLTEYSGESIE